MTAPAPSVVISRLKKERKLWEEKLGKDLQEKQAIGRYAVADQFARHCHTVDNATQALAMAWNETMEGSWDKIKDENAALQEKMELLEHEIEEWKNRYKEAQERIQELEVKDRTKETQEAEAKAEQLKQNFLKIKTLFVHQVEEKDEEIEDLKSELVKTKLENKQILEDNARWNAFMEGLENKGGEISLISKELHQAAIRRKEELAKFNNLSAKYESLGCRYQAVCTERLAIREQLQSITGSDIPLVALGGLERVHAPCGSIRIVNDREVEWRISHFQSEIDTASDTTVLFSDSFEMEGIELRLEIAPKSGKKPAASFPFVRYVKPHQEQRLAFLLSVGEQTFSSQAPRRPNEGRPWVDMDAIINEIDRDGVICFTFELIEVCGDEVRVEGNRATWTFMTGANTRAYDQPGVSLGMSPLFSTSGFENLQLEFFPRGEEDSDPEKGWCSCHVIVPRGVTMEYELSISNVGEAHGKAWGSLLKPFQRLPHVFSKSVGDSPLEVTLRILTPKENFDEGPTEQVRLNAAGRKKRISV